MSAEPVFLSWTEVLATLEAHAESAELLLASHPRNAGAAPDGHTHDPADHHHTDHDHADHNHDFGYDGHHPVPAIAPWEWELPSPGQLPPLPSELEDRATAVRDRMLQLQSRLARELEHAPPSHEHAHHLFPAVSRSMFIDVTV